MGLNSGEVVVGKIGDDLRMDYTAQGHTVGLAQRMEAARRAGQGLSHGAHGGARRRATSRSTISASSSVKGVHEPVRVFELEGVGRAAHARSTSRAPAASRASSAAPTRWRRSRRRSAGRSTGNGQVVGVVAEAGLGKSRLCFEFLERCRARGIAVYEAHGVVARQAHSVSADPRALPRLLRHHRAGRRPQARARRSPAACCCSTSASGRAAARSSTSSAFPIPSARRRGWSPRRASASSSP